MGDSFASLGLSSARRATAAGGIPPGLIQSSSVSGPGTTKPSLASISAKSEASSLDCRDIETVRNHIREVGLSEDELIAGDELVVDEADPMTLLYLLNEDFFTGGLTTIGFRSERKEPRT